MYYISIILVLYWYCISIILVLYCILVSKKVGSDVIEKIARSREERHESALDEMHQELLLISSVSLSLSVLLIICLYQYVLLHNNTYSIVCGIYTG